MWYCKSIHQWRASIGLFYGHVCWHLSTKLGRGCCDFKMVGFLWCCFGVFVFLLLLKHGNVEINPGPKKKEPIIFSCFHWNVNNILAHKKLSSLEAYNAIHQYDMYIWNKFRLFLFQLMTLLFPSKGITLFGQIILAILKGVVFACIIEKIHFWE